MKVEVYRDIACPWCRLGVYRFERALAADGDSGDVEIVHRPYQLRPDKSREPVLVIDNLSEVYGRERAEFMLSAMTDLGAREGVEFQFDRALAVNTLTAHRLLWFAAREYPATVGTLVKALYNAHFRDGVNVADNAALTIVAEAAGLDGARVSAFLASEEGVAEVSEQVAAARRAGITTVPTYVFGNGETLSGAVEPDSMVQVLRRVRAAT
jgi:predicted DsbA family dithiol-disulfide isomerase